jgi:hypothetical protein
MGSPVSVSDADGRPRPIGSGAAVAFASGSSPEDDGDLGSGLRLVCGSAVGGPEIAKILLDRPHLIPQRL